MIALATPSQVSLLQGSYSFSHHLGGEFILSSPGPLCTPQEPSRFSEPELGSSLATAQTISHPPILPKKTKYCLISLRPNLLPVRFPAISRHRSSAGFKPLTLPTQDHCIRVLKADGSEVAFQVSTDAPVGAFCAFSRSGQGTDQVRF